MGKAREQSYAQDKAMIQTAVDSFFTAGDNVRYLGQRQFPLLGNSKSTGNADTWTQNIQVDSSGDSVLDSSGQQIVTAARTSNSLTVAFNPVRGTRGGEPKWRDGDGDGNRALNIDGTPTTSENNLNSELETLDPARSSLADLGSDGNSTG